jgi:hypothetical protein
MEHSASEGRMRKPKSAKLSYNKKNTQPHMPPQKLKGSGFPSNFPHNRLTKDGPSASVRALLSEVCKESTSVGSLASVGSNSLPGVASVDLRTVGQHKKIDHFVPSAIPCKTDALYSIRLTFESETAYLAVPCSNFTKILGDGNKCLPKVADGTYYVQSYNAHINSHMEYIFHLLCHTSPIPPMSPNSPTSPTLHTYTHTHTHTHTHTYTQR